MKVIWSASAKRNFRRTIDYLMEEWTDKEAKNFTSKSHELIQKISIKYFILSAFKNQQSQKMFN